MQFRKDINGLRAIAVIAVVLFHFNSSWLSGGFAGVDVFFVISGYLMTGIIFKGIQQDNFSIVKFYAARANRIIPALAVLCLVLLVFGWFYLTPLDYKALGKHVVGSLGFISNFIYWRESGYFDVTSHDKWLLHTWSLSAEWQFYIIYPLLLVALRKFMTLKAMKATVLLATVFGFIFCVIVTYSFPDPAYYLLPTRAWEMMIGGVAFLYPFALQEKSKKYVEWVGLALIVTSYLLVTEENPWPGYLAVFPVLGAFLMIQAQRNDSFITANIVSQKIGSWSYSIYLWHWPLVVTIYYFSLSEMYIYIGVFLSILLGFLSNKYIEKIEFKSIISWKTLHTSKPLWFVAFIMLISYFPYHNASNFLKSNPEEAEQFLIGHNYIDKDGMKFAHKGEVISLNNASDSDVDFFALGDSNLAHYSYGISKSNNYKVLMSWVGSCLNLPNYATKPYAGWMDASWLNDCSNNYKIIKSIPLIPVIIAHQWDPRPLICHSGKCAKDYKLEDYYVALEDELRELVGFMGDRSIYIIGQIPAPKTSMVQCMKRYEHHKCERFTSEFSGVRIKTNMKLKEFSDNYSNVSFINPFPSICTVNNVCETISNDKNLFFDAGHLSQHGSYIIWSYIESMLANKKDIINDKDDLEL
jgi:peptidoglycan/LPS O-acetylase OafA/YrhL